MPMADFKLQSLKSDQKRSIYSAFNSPNFVIFLSSVASVSILDSLFISIFFKSSEIYVYFEEYLSKVDPSKFAGHWGLFSKSLDRISSLGFLEFRFVYLLISADPF